MRLKQLLRKIWRKILRENSNLLAISSIIIIVISMLTISVSYAAMYVSPVGAMSKGGTEKQVIDEPNHLKNKASESSMVISFASHVPLQKVIQSVYSGFQLKFWKVNPAQRISWDWNSPEKGAHNPIQVIQTKYNIYVYANRLTRKVGISKDLGIARALTTQQRTIWELKKGRLLRKTIAKWAHQEKATIIWKIKNNPMIDEDKIVLGQFSYALNYSVINIIKPKNSAIVEKSKNKKTYYIERVEKIHALYAPKFKGNPSFIVRSGSLLRNVQRFVKKFHYQLKWNVYDPKTNDKATLNWIGDEKITRQNPIDILKKILAPYPLAVSIYRKNRVIEVTNLSAY